MMVQLENFNLHVLNPLGSYKQILIVSLCSGLEYAQRFEKEKLHVIG